jgi:D-tyrosyl-tRNA(Tyr) deacylase
MVEKTSGLRLFGDAEGKMNLGLGDVGGAVLVVSQFTLYGNAEKGKRPSFIDAARSEEAIPLYERFIAGLRERGLRVESGEFGAMMRNVAAKAQEPAAADTATTNEPPKNRDDR